MQSFEKKLDKLTYREKKIGEENERKVFTVKVIALLALAV